MKSGHWRGVKTTHTRHCSEPTKNFDAFYEIFVACFVWVGNCWCLSFRRILVIKRLVLPQFWGCKHTSGKLGDSGSSLVGTRCRSQVRIWGNCLSKGNLHVNTFCSRTCNLTCKEYKSCYFHILNSFEDKSLVCKQKTAHRIYRTKNQKFDHIGTC